MASPTGVTLQFIAAVANGVALSQTRGSAGALTLNGSLVTAGVATMDAARRIGITSAGNDSGITFTVTGIDRWKMGTITETLTGANVGTVQTVNDFLTVTSVTSSAATAGNVTVGTTSVGSSEWFVDEIDGATWMMRVGVRVNGTINYTVEHTYDDPNKAMPSLQLVQWNTSMFPKSANPPDVWAHPVLQQMTTSAENNYADGPIFAHRLTINSGTGAARMTSIKASIGT